MQNQKIKKEKQLINELFEKHSSLKKEFGKSENHVYNETHNITSKIDTNINSANLDENESNS